MKFQLMLICLNFFFLFVLIPACGDVALSFDACNEGGVTPASDEIVTNPASANEESSVLGSKEWPTQGQSSFYG